MDISGVVLLQARLLDLLHIPPGYLTTLVTLYYLAIKNMPTLLGLFPHFQWFAVVATVLGAPTCVLVGWVHIKRSRLLTSELDMAAESNPYQYKLPPGYTREAYIPAVLAQLKILRRLAESSALLSDSERAEIGDLEKKLTTLVEGGYLGLPRRSLNF